MICAKCHQDKPEDDFAPAERVKRPSSARCRPCRQAESRARYEKTRERYIEYQRRFREQMGREAYNESRRLQHAKKAEDPGFREKSRNRSAAQRQAAPQRNAEYQRAYRERHRAAIRERNRLRVETLTDDVVVSCLFAGIPVPPRALIPPELIQAKRLQMMVRRDAQATQGPSMETTNGRHEHDAD